MKEDLALLFLRLGFGLALALGHGLPKLMSFAETAAKFPDPIGLGPKTALALAIMGELVGALGVAVGLFTRLAALPAAITMAVAFFVIHSQAAWSTREMSFLYGVPFVVIMLAGPGRFSLDHLIRKKR